jgi:hypothetical protein
MSEAQEHARAIEAALARPFAPSEVKWKPAMVKNDRCLAMAYIDARAVQDRLDEVMGIGGWKTEYHQIGTDNFECRLSLRIGRQWITKADVGSTSEQPDAGDRLKAAYSDALKRAAVAFGVGRYLYRLQSQWVDYDPVKKRIVGTPQLPAIQPVKNAVAAARDSLESAKTLGELAAVWEGTPPETRAAVLAVKDQKKAQLSKSGKAA